MVSVEQKKSWQRLETGNVEWSNVSALLGSIYLILNENDILQNL